VPDIFHRNDGVFRRFGRVLCSHRASLAQVAF
jgi:hypothetical protein